MKHELLRLESQLMFAAKEVERHQWSPSVRDTLMRNLTDVRRRLKDDCVNISVVGQFSSGKSSFINALLGLDLLSMDEMPDTTLVPVVLTYAPTPIYQEISKNATTRPETMTMAQLTERLKCVVAKDIRVEDFPDMDAYMERFYAERANALRRAADIVQINVGIPSEFLRKGFRVIDTPGLASGNPRCAEFARKFMAITDTSIIVAEAMRPLTLDTRKILDDIIGERIKHCMVVFTRYDMVTPSRRDKVRQFQEASTRAAFGLTPQQMPIFMTVPPTVLAAAKGSRFGDEHDEMLALTRRSLQALEAEAVNRRKVIIAGALQTLFGTLYDNLGSNISILKQHCSERLEHLMKSRSKPLDPFIRQQHQRLEALLKSQGAILKYELVKELNKEIILISQRCHKKVFVEQDTVKKLQNYLKAYFPNFLKYQLGGLRKIGDDKINAYFKIIRKLITEDFEKAVKTEFERLDIIPMEIEMKLTETTIDHSSITDKTSIMSSIVGERRKQDNKEISMSVIGGVIGTFIAPGIGSAIGAGVGFLFGSTGDSGKGGIEGARELLKANYESSMKLILDDYKMNIIKQVEIIMQDTAREMLQHIDRYGIRYRESIDAKIRREESEQQETRRQLVMLTQELTEIKRHKTELEEICKTN